PLSSTTSRCSITDDAATLLLGTSVLSSLKGGGLRQAEDPVNPLQPSPILSTKPGQLQIDASMVARWVRQYRQEGESAFERTLRRQQTPKPTDAQQRLKELERENDWLKRIVGEKDLEIAILRDLFKKGSPR